MNEIEKLRMLIPHWIEHNDEHAEEYRRWAEDVNETRAELLTAIEALESVNRSLGVALERLGGETSHRHVG
jgi:hypothetical protein